MKELTQIKPVSWIKFDIYGLLMLGIDDCISHRGAEIAEKDFIADAPGLLKSPRNRAGGPMKLHRDQCGVP